MQPLWLTIESERNFENRYNHWCFDFGMTSNTRDAVEKLKTHRTKKLTADTAGTHAIIHRTGCRPARWI